MFDPDTMAKRVNLAAGEDLIVTSANNYYEGVTQKEVEEYYAARIDTTDQKPVSYGLNSKMVKDASGRITERVWRVGGMYSAAIEKIVEWLEKASEVAEGQQKKTIDELIAYYKSGRLRDFDRVQRIVVGGYGFACRFRERIH